MTEITMIPIGLLEHHPKNPRASLGDLSELIESIRNRGIMQNLTVVPDAERTKYLVVIGNRRLEAAKAAGLVELPCAIDAQMTEKEQMATMLMENMQRQDLTVYEQAMGFQMMMDLGFTPKEIGDKTGFSESTVKSRIKLTKIRKKDFEAACNRGATLMDFAELDKLDSADDRYEVMQSIGTVDFRVELAQKLREQEFEKAEKRLVPLMKKLGIKPLPLNERYSNKWESFLDFEITSSDQFIENRLTVLMEDDDRYAYELVRYAGTNGRLDIKRATKGAGSGGLSDAEKQRRAETRRTNDHCRKVKAVYRQAYELRCEFVKGFNARIGGGISTILESCMLSALRQKNHWDDKLSANHEWNDAYIRMIFDLPEKPEKGSTLAELVNEKADGNLCKILLAFALGGGIVNDHPELGWYDRSNGNYEAKSWYAVDDANRVYGLLEKCGYQLSTMEKQLRDGTHECYKWED